MEGYRCKCRHEDVGNTWRRIETDLWPLRDVFGAVADEADGFHAGVWKRGVAGELRQTLDGVLEGVDGGREVLLEYIRCEPTTGNGKTNRELWVRTADDTSEMFFLCCFFTH